jgi:hypothetical protein
MTQQSGLETFYDNRAYDHATFNRFQALQAQGPEGVRAIAGMLWGRLAVSDQTEYIEEAVEAIGSDSEAQARQNAHINMRLVTEYLVARGDPRKHYHRVNLRRDV